MSVDTKIIDQEIKAALRVMEPAGMCGDHFVASRFPYTYHHDFLRRLDDGFSRNDIAELMLVYAEQHGALKYIRRCLYGAMLYLMTTYPMEFAKGIRNYEFARFVAALADEHKDAVFDPDELIRANNVQEA